MDAKRSATLPGATDTAGVSAAATAGSMETCRADRTLTPALAHLKISAPNILVWVIPDDQPPPDVSTPFTMESPEGTVVVARERDVTDGRIAFELPILVEGLSRKVDADGCAWRISFAGIESTPIELRPGEMTVPVRFPVGADRIDLGSAVVHSCDGRRALLPVGTR